MDGVFFLKYHKHISLTFSVLEKLINCDTSEPCQRGFIEKKFFNNLVPISRNNLVKPCAHV